jgi:pimeloyl-ACP methyl ester carboxylesterase
MPNLVADVIGLLDALKIDKVRLVGHDWGAALGWQACIAHPERFDRFVAVSVGHPTAYAKAPLEQKLKGYYILVFQLVGVAERLLRAGNWKLLRVATRHCAEIPEWIRHLSRRGRLTAALNYYRANFGLLLTRDPAPVRVPVLGIWSSADVALCEAQMTASQAYVEAPWRYERIDGTGHWIPLEAPARLNALLLDYFRE